MHRKDRKSTLIVHDGKMGWIVVIGAFFAHVITHGIVYSFGMMFSSLERMFHASKAEIAWIPSIMSGSLYLIGPLASLMINRFGCRIVTIIGSCIGFTGYILSIFVSNLYILYITMGLIAGCGFGMIFLSAIVIVTQYFIKYRAIACGIGLSGAGVGAFVFSPLIEKLLTVYGWHGALLITSGLILNCIVAAFAFQTMEVQNVKKLENDSNLYKTCENTFEDCQLRGHDVSYDAKKKDSDLDDDHIDALDKLLDEHQSDNIDKHVVKTSISELYLKDERNEKAITIEIVKTDKIIEDENKYGAVDEKQLPMSLIARQFALMKNVEFVAFILSQFLFFFGFYLPYIYIPGKASISGINEDNIAWIGSTIGLSSVSGRIVLGYIADRTFIDRYVMFKVALLIAGVSTSFGPLLESYWTLMLYAVIYGISTGITLSLTSVVLVDLVGIHLLPDAMGLNNLLSGFGSLLGPPIAGLLYDQTKSYNASFLAPGIAITVSGIMLVIAGCKKKNKSGKIDK